MRCDACGADVRAGQKFCMECGASLQGSTGLTTATTGSGDDPTRVMAAHGPVGTGADGAVESAFAPPHDDATARLPTTTTARGRVTVSTSELNVVPATTTAVHLGDTSQLPAAEKPVDERGADRPARRFRLRPMLLLAVVAAAAAAVGIASNLIEIEAVSNDVFEIGTWRVNDFGTNNTAAGMLAAAAMVLGALAWCFGFRWGAGLAGGGGAALAGWVALVIGLAEWPIATAERATEIAPLTITRDLGYWSLVGAAAVGILVLLISLGRAGRDGRAGLDPWIAALGAVSFLIAAGGPLIPLGTADWSGNYSSDTLGVDLPTWYFVGRAVQLGLLALGGVVGLLLVRRYGLGLAVGAATSAGWLLVTSATDQTENPIGPGYANPGAANLEPHAVTVVGMALVGFFLLVAIVMALLDADR